MVKGLPKWIIKKYGISKKAWRIHRAGTKKKGSHGTHLSTKTIRRGSHKGSHMAKKTVPLGLIVGFVPTVDEVLRVNQKFPGADAQTKFRLLGNALTRRLLGYDFLAPKEKDRFRMRPLVRGLGPLLLGWLVLHKFVGGTLGVNRALGRMKVPLIRL